MGACAAKLNEHVIPQAIDQPKIDAALKKEKVLRAIEAEKQVAAWKKLLEDPAAAAAYNKSLLVAAVAAPAADKPAEEKKEGDAAAAPAADAAAAAPAADAAAAAPAAEEVKPPESGVWVRAESLKGADGDAAADVTLTKETSDKDITKYAVQFVTNAKWRATFKTEYWTTTGKAAADEKLGKLPGGAGEKLIPEVEKKVNEALDKGVTDFAKALVEAAEKGEPLATDAEKAEATGAAAPAADKPAEGAAAAEGAAEAKPEENKA